MVKIERDREKGIKINEKYNKNEKAKQKRYFYTLFKNVELDFWT